MHPVVCSRSAGMERLSSWCGHIVFELCGIKPQRGKHEEYSKYFERESKYRGLPKLTRKMAEATGYSEQLVNHIVSEKSASNGAASTSPPKRYKVERSVRKVNPDDFDTWHILWMKDCHVMICNTILLRMRGLCGYTSGILLIQWMASP